MMMRFIVYDRDDQLCYVLDAPSAMTVQTWLYDECSPDDAFTVIEAPAERMRSPFKIVRQAIH